MTAPDPTGWRLSRTGAGPAGLEPYEATLLDGLFGGTQEVRVADLKRKLGITLNRAGLQLKQDMATRGWISGRGWKIALFAVAGSLLTVTGLVLMPILGAAFGGGWIGAAVAVVGLAWLCTCAAMVRRPRREAELWRRAASFRAYVRRSGGRADALGAWLPFAIAFGADRTWAVADGAEAGSSVPWFGAGSLAGLWLFEDTMDDTVSYVPPSTSSGGWWSGGGSGWSGGSSGFDGGSSGGGDGGGGGGSW